MTIFPAGSILVGPDDVYAVQLEDTETTSAVRELLGDESPWVKPMDSSMLQVNGVPVLVHPESMLLPDVTQSGAGSMPIFPTGTLTIGADEITAVQTSDEQPEDDMVL